MLNGHKADKLTERAQEVLADVISLADYRQQEVARMVYRRLEITASAGDFRAAQECMGGLTEMRRVLRRGGVR